MDYKYHLKIDQKKESAQHLHIIIIHSFDRKNKNARIASPESDLTGIWPDLFTC